MIPRFYLIFIIFLFSNFIFASGGKSSQLVDEAWKAWQKNNKALVEEKFQEALVADSNNTRAYIGLFILYSMQHKENEAWKNFNKFIKIEPNYFPYVYSFMLSDIIRLQELTNPAVIDLYNNLSSNPDKDGILAAMAHEKLGNYYLLKNDFINAEKNFNDLNVVKEWLIIGPFENISASGYNKVFPPETEFKKEKIYEGKNGVPAQWYKPKTIRKDLWIDFTRYYPNGTSIYYANTFIYSPVKRTVQLRIGTSGSLRAFLNNQLVIDIFDENNNDLDTYIAEVDLQKGWNRLLVKCGFSEITSCNFLVRITNPDGNKIDDLKYSINESKYTANVHSPVVIKENFAENYFKQKIKENPDVPENYVILADAYLRNDKAIEAELVLNNAIKLYPDCMLFRFKILEAYLRGKKDDEMETTFETISKADSTIPDVLRYKLAKFIQNEDFDKAWETIKKMEKVVPGKKILYDSYLEYYSKKKEVEKVIDITHKAYELFPNDQEYAYLESALAYQKTRSQKEAIKILEEYIKRNYSQNALYYIAQYYLQDSDINKWQEYMGKLLEVSPASPGYYYQIAETYFSMQNYDKAEENYRKALDICGTSSQYWSKLGQTYKMKDKKEDAISAYNEALKYYPADYDSREILRELNGQKSYFQLFEQENINELIKIAPTQKDYPLDNGVFLLNDMKRIVYKKGTSENSEEILLRLFNKKGIDDFKEYWISYNSYSEELIIEKAVVIKNDGSEIKADIDENHIVFKSLEENDFIYIKYRIKNKYFGKLSNHYWDSYNFNYFYPAKKVNYSILLEDDTDFKYVTQNMEEKPVIKKIKEGSIYRWSLNDSPSVKQEYGMPSLSDIGKILHVSNIPNWGYLVDWYTDLSQNKARSSYELKDLITSLFKDKENPTEEVKIQTIYNYITENIRYSSVSFRQSGFIPQTARDVLINRIGDCKDKAVLCKALLNEVGINSYLVLLNTTDNGLNNNVLPSLCFNHCILCVETSKGEKFLDLTAENFSSKTVPSVDINAFYLLIKPGVTSPARMKKEQFFQSNVTRFSNAEIEQDGRINITRMTSKTGILGAYTRSGYRYLDGNEIKKAMRENLSNGYPNVKLNDVSFKNLDKIELPAEYTLNYEIPDYISETGDFLLIKIPWGDKADNDPGFSYDQREFPYYTDAVGDTLYEEFSLKFPDNYTLMESGSSVKYSSPYADYSVNFSVNNNSLIGKRTFIFKKQEISVEDYGVCKDFINKVMKEDNRQILLRKKM